MAIHLAGSTYIIKYRKCHICILTPELALTYYIIIALAIATPCQKNSHIANQTSYSLCPSTMGQEGGVYGVRLLI